MTVGQRIGYALLMGSCKVTGWLPNRFLYGPFKHFIYFILHRVLKYRVNVVSENLHNSFPEKDEKELAKIEHDFYMHLSEIMVDTIKLASIGKKEIMERMFYLDIEAYNATLAKKTWIAAMSHFGSWELTINFALYCNHDVLAVYRPLKSAVFNRFYQHVRGRFGTRPIAMNDIFKEVYRIEKNHEKPATIALIADQTPPYHEIKHWYPFLHQDTPFFSGVEKMAVRFGIPVLFTYIRRVAPLHYQANFIEIYDGKEHVEEHEITKRYIMWLETMIRETPHLWMWSHRRWKHKKPNAAECK